MVFNDEEGSRLLEWWNWLHNEKQRGIRAELKRCGTLQEVMTKKGFIRLTQVLPRLCQSEVDIEGLLIVSAILAVVKTPSDKHFSSLLGSKKSDKPIFSELRFQRLLASSDAEGFFHGLRRAVMQVGEQANPVLLADSILHWCREQQHPDWFKGKAKWQYQWANHYYNDFFEEQQGASV